MDVGLVLGHIVLDGDPAVPPQKGNRAPNFRSMSIITYQTAGWIKMPLGVEVGLGPDHIVLDADPADPAPPPPNGYSPPLIFSPYLLWPNGFIDQDATW